MQFLYLCNSNWLYLIQFTIQPSEGNMNIAGIERTAAKKGAFNFWLAVEQTKSENSWLSWKLKATALDARRSLQHCGVREEVGGWMCINLHWRLALSKNVLELKLRDESKRENHFASNEKNSCWYHMNNFLRLQMPPESIPLWINTNQVFQLLFAHTALSLFLLGLTEKF